MWTRFGRISLLVTLASIVGVNLAQDTTPNTHSKERILDRMVSCSNIQ